VAAPAHFKEAVSADAGGTEGWKTAEPSDQLPRGAWWILYRDPDLSALEEQAAKSNQSVAQAEAAYRQAWAVYREAFSQLLPTVSADPSVTRSRSSAGLIGVGGVGASGATQGSAGTSGSTSAAGGTAAAAGGGTHTIFDLPFEASYEVDLWGAVRNTVSQNRSLAQSSAASLASEILGIQAQVAQDYFNLRAVDEQRFILDTTMEDYRASLHLTQTLYNTGIDSAEDVSEATTQLETAEAEATDLGIARAQYEHAIAVLIGVPPGSFSLPVKRFKPNIPEIPLAVPSTLLERRPDVAAAERQVAAANAGIGVARAAYFPQLTLSASAGFEALSASRWLDWANRFWSVGAGASQTLFDGGERFAATDRAKAQYDQNVAQYRQTVLTAFQTVEDNLVSLRVLSREVVQQHRAASSAETTVRLSLTRYQQGVDSYVNVISAQNIFLTNRQAELQAQLKQILASIGLIQNLGGGWDRAQIDSDADRAKHAARGVEPKAEYAPAETAKSVANPPDLPAPEKTPETMLKEDESLTAPPPPPPQ
jgi:NodT family efflux transporter outer membrane factor (OMF) lipoprotein